jgi:6-phosphogluconolactonase/glucosamine-6-phosphate isomerase/deaminase
MRFVKMSSHEPAAKYVAGLLRSHIEKGERVLWLISGGSVIRVAAAVSKQLEGLRLEHLTVSLTDERPGPIGHPLSNWRGLEESGFELRGAHLRPILTDDGIKTETAAYARFLREQLERNDFRLGTFGIGPDGHTAGLPAQGSAASDELADYFEAGDFRRISSTPNAIANLDEVVAYVTGESKRPQLDRLAQDLPYEQQSAQSLKLAPKLTIFNDFKGERL